MKRRAHRPVTTYPRDAVLLVGEVADALRCSTKTVMRARFPVAYITEQTPRYIWGQIVDELMRYLRDHAR